MKPLRRCTLAFVVQCLLLCQHVVSQQQPADVVDTTQGARTSLLPLPILFYTPETGIAGGAALVLLHREQTGDTLARPSSVMVDFIYTEKKQIIAEMYPDIYLRHGKYHIVGSIHHSKYPLKFYGIGNDTPEDDEETYTSRAFRISLDALHKITQSVNAGVSALYDYRTLSGFSPQGVLKTGSIRGSRGGTTMGGGGIVQWDTRDNIFMPAGGRFYAFSVRAAARSLGSDFAFSYLTLDLREYLGITETSTLALQALATLTDGKVPFYMLAQLGGAYIMRGYYEGRYRDKKLLAAQAEYRFPVFWRFGGVLFAGAGDVAPSLSRFNAHTLKSSYGFGLRYMFDPVEKMRIRLDVGFGQGTSGLYITAGEAF